MKKTLMMALVLMASASFSTVSAKDKKEKTAQQVSVDQPVRLVTANDSISFAAGYTLSEGLDKFLKQNFNVGPADMPIVLQGYRESISKRNEPNYNAYSAGMQIAQMVTERMLPRLMNEFKFGKDSLNEAVLLSGFEAALAGDTTHYTESSAKDYFVAARKAITDKRNALTKEEGELFLAENKTKKDVVTLPSGLQYKVLHQGKGDIPALDDKIQVVYEGRTLDGKVFDATEKHQLPKDRNYDEFGLEGLIKGWQEALTHMPVGSKWEVYVPWELAYGERGAGAGIPPYSTLVFTLELKGIVSATPASQPATPNKGATPAKPNRIKKVARKK